VVWLEGGRLWRVEACVMVRIAETRSGRVAGEVMPV
jgi:hypothetical protein